MDGYIFRDFQPKVNCGIIRFAGFEALRKIKVNENNNGRRNWVMLLRQTTACIYTARDTIRNEFREKSKHSKTSRYITYIPANTFCSVVSGDLEFNLRQMAIIITIVNYNFENNSQRSFLSVGFGKNVSVFFFIRTV